jgi:hypothetical protein
VRLEWKLSWSKVSDPISLINDTHTQYNEEKGMLFDMVVDMADVILSTLFFILYYLFYLHNARRYFSFICVNPYLFFMHVL